MRKCLLFIMILCTLALTGCKEKSSFTQPTQEVVEYPSQAKKDNINGYLNDVESPSEQSGIKGEISEEKPNIYYANKKSKKFHRPDCTYAKKISEQSIRLEESYEVLINEGYTPCQVCKP